jgi:hypothetical protein
MNKPYHERPDWILKSIVYFCDNYTIDGEDLQAERQAAIETYRKHRCDNLRRAFDWNNNEKTHDFWHCLYWLQGGLNSQGRLFGPPCVGATCKPWTDYEKRKIAKMPRVK